MSASAVLARQPPVLDVRAPAEFSQGSLPGAINSPILDNDERRQVGLAYREQGSQAATELGHQLVSGQVRAERIARWTEFVAAHPEACITCWRGGQRSAIAQQWLAETGIEVPRITGGYKMVRQACLDTLADTSAKQWYVLAGRTGSQKTAIINELTNSIDLEGHARHRGSAFGGYDEPQPSQASFENALAFAWRRHSGSSLVVEDESRTIGRAALPPTWHTTMQAAPLVVVDAGIAERVEHIYGEYVQGPLMDGASHADLAARYRAALQRISRRLGGLRHAQIDQLMGAAGTGQGSHQAWIEALLVHYYDPMYDYQLARKSTRITFRGARADVTQFLASLPG